MKINIFFLLFILLISSCSSKKEAGISSFKLVVGRQALTTPMLGGAFVETEDLTTTKKNLIKLDADNSATIPLGTYNLLFVTFTGPAEKSGNMYCGSVSNAALLSASSTLTVKITMSECSLSKYSDLISQLINKNTTWDNASFDQGKWGQ